MFLFISVLSSTLSEAYLELSLTSKHQPDKIVKHTQTIRR